MVNRRGRRAGGRRRELADQTAVQRVRHWLNQNTRSGVAPQHLRALRSRQRVLPANGSTRRMTYSSALFSTGANDLESAQTAKYRALARDIGIGAGDHVLEIGCGWGGFAEFAAREIGCRVTGLTISREQHEFARRSASPRPASPTGSRSSCRTIATRPAPTTASPRSRCSRRSARNTGRCSSAR